MERAGSELTAFDETVVFLDYFSELPDHRQAGKVIIRFPKCCCCPFGGAGGGGDIHRHRAVRREEARSAAPVPAVSERHALARSSRRYFAMLDAAAVPALLRGLGRGADRRAAGGDRDRRQDAAPLLQKTDAKEAIHMVSAFAARQRLVLGQVKVAEKSNEITAIPRLLDMLAIEGAIVTIDAMGCQRDIAAENHRQEGRLRARAQGQSGHPARGCRMFAAEQKAAGFKDTKISRHETVDGDHGRIETRNYTAIHDVDWLQQRHKWPGLKGVVMVESQREIADKIERETRFYITSLAWPPASRPHDPRPLGNREQLALGDGHGLPRR